MTLTNWIIGALLVLALVSGCVLMVDVANAKETTTLDEALERPVKVEKHVDQENGVVCYWTDRYPKYLSCVKVEEK